jgi:hypothetical protein
MLKIYDNWDNVRFPAWGDRGTPFYDPEAYLGNSGKDIRTRLTGDLGFDVKKDEDMKNNIDAKNFGLFSISTEGHVTVGFVDLRYGNTDENIYLADYSLLHYYYDEEIDPVTGLIVIDPITGNPKLKTIFSSLKPTELKKNVDGTEQIEQKPDEYVRLLNTNNLQECGTCFLWFSESIAYINSNFRHGNQVIKAYDIGQAQVEIGAILSEKVDGGKLGLDLGLTLNRPRDMAKYDRFFYFGFKPDSNEFDVSGIPVEIKPVYILKDFKVSRILLTKRFEEMLLQKQKEFIPASFLKKDFTKDKKYMDLITPGFFSIRNKTYIQDKIETGEIYIELFAIMENENNKINYAVHNFRKLLIEDANNAKIPGNASWKDYGNNTPKAGKYSVYTNKNHSYKIYILDEGQDGYDFDIKGLIEKIEKYGWEKVKSEKLYNVNERGSVYSEWETTRVAQ